MTLSCRKVNMTQPSPAQLAWAMPSASFCGRALLLAAVVIFMAHNENCDIDEHAIYEVKRVTTFGKLDHVHLGGDADGGSLRQVSHIFPPCSHRL